MEPSTIITVITAILAGALIWSATAMRSQSKRIGKFEGRLLKFEWNEHPVLKELGKRIGDLEKSASSLEGTVGKHGQEIANLQKREPKAKDAETTLYRGSVSGFIERNPRFSIAEIDGFLRMKGFAPKQRSLAALLKELGCETRAEKVKRKGGGVTTRRVWLAPKA